jgi:hypothetical protein
MLVYNMAADPELDNRQRFRVCGHKADTGGHQQRSTDINRQKGCMEGAGPGRRSI